MIHLRTPSIIIFSVIMLFYVVTYIIKNIFSKVINVFSNIVLDVIFMNILTIFNRHYQVFLFFTFATKLERFVSYVLLSYEQ